MENRTNNGGCELAVGTLGIFLILIQNTIYVYKLFMCILIYNLFII